MLFKISLSCLDTLPVLPLNYQYELSAWIYKVIANADAEYATFLHSRGYNSGRRSFKLFSFSNLNIPKFRIQGDRIIILGQKAWFYIGFYLDRIAEEFIRGLFQNQYCRLGDRKNQVSFQVETIEICPLQLPEGSVRIRMLSPLVVGERREGMTTDTYLSPLSADFGHLLFRNLIDKYRSASNDTPAHPWAIEAFQFQPLANPEPRSKLIIIKAGTPEETRVRGWLFDFKLEIPIPLLELALLAGFGKANAQGFGFGRVYSENNTRRQFDSDKSDSQSRKS